MMQRWNNFWFEKTSRYTLCLIRVGIGLLVLGRSADYFGLSKVLNIYTTNHYNYFNSGQEYFLNYFPMPFPFFSWLPIPSYSLFNSIEILIAILAILFTLGLYTRIVGPLLATLCTYTFLLSQLTYHHHMQLLVIALIIVGFARSNEYLSLVAFRLKKSSVIPDRPVLPIRLLQIQVGFLYFGSLVGKLNTGWFDGTALHAFLENGDIAGHFATIAFSMLNTQLVSIGIITTVAFLAIGLWIPRLKKASLYVGMCLHICIIIMMDIYMYSALMFVLYIAFVHPRPRQYTVLYDGLCLMCNRARTFVTPFDWLQRITFVDIYDAQAVSMLKFPAPAQEVLLTDMYLIDASGHEHRGFYAWRKIITLLPLTFLFSPLLYIPGIPTLGEKIYRHIADTRTRVLNRH